ncbi:MAG: ABC transporter permease subunit [Desulfovibrionaceae bacterium]|nr:ABC transporter permease subunit [Desulfovibrionaceae bacterium]
MPHSYLKHAVLPLLVVLATLGIALWLPDSAEHPAAQHPYFVFTALGVLAVMLAFTIAGMSFPSLGEAFARKAPFYAGVLSLFCLYNILTAKTALLPVLYFPSPDNIFGVFFEDMPFLLKCLAYSLRLLVLGWIGGIIAGFLTGVAVGFNRHVRYWVLPWVRILGPIPATAWIPIVLVCFPSVVSASAFLIGLAVWFPTTVLTASGIANIEKAYFEAAATLGASKSYTIRKVGIPAAMPHMFLGLFNGTCASFLTLVTAEMLGAKYGIGWYINWQKEMMAYPNVYAGLMVMSLTCFALLTLLFRVRNKVLVWQKGVIQW